MISVRLNGGPADGKTYEFGLHATFGRALSHRIVTPVLGFGMLSYERVGNSSEYVYVGSWWPPGFIRDLPDDEDFGGWEGGDA
jgi:hypothetical protein